MSQYTNAYPASAKDSKESAAVENLKQIYDAQAGYGASVEDPKTDVREVYSQLLGDKPEGVAVPGYES